MTILNRENVSRRFPWLLERDLSMIISTDEDGLLAAALLHHHLGWRIAGYYDCSTVWLSSRAQDREAQPVWVDLDVTRADCLSIGHHILTLEDETCDELQQVCNPNLLAGIGLNRFSLKYPFSTILFLLWIHNISLRKDLMARLLVLHADSTWLNIQNYTENCQEWEQRLPDYDWRWLFQQVDSELFEKRMNEHLLPQIRDLRGYVEDSQLRSRHLSLPAGQIRFNPDWDIDIALGYLRIIGTYLKWSPPSLPDIIEVIEGRRKILKQSKPSDDFPAQMHTGDIFSYAFTHRDTLNFTELEWRKQEHVVKQHGET